MSESLFTLASFIANIATTVTGLILLVSLVAIFRQLRQMSRASRLQLLGPVIERFNSQASVSARDFVVQRLPDAKDLDAEARAHIDRVSRDFNDLGFLVYRGLVDEADVIPNWGMSCTRHWERLEPYVRQMQARDYPHRRIFFRYLAVRSHRYLRQNLRKLMMSVPQYDGNAQRLVDDVMLEA